MKYFAIFLLGLSLAFGARAAPEAASCLPASPVLRVGVFNTTGTLTAPYVQQRIAAMSSQLPAVAQSDNLDVVCLTELRDPALRETALQSFRSDPNWYVYQPDAKNQPGCQNACITPLYTAYSFTLSLSRWVQFCSFRNIPGTDYSCVKATSESEFQSCHNQFCPFLVPELRSQGNSSCEYCLSDAREGESLSERVLRCSTAYNPVDGAQCMGHDAQPGTTIVSRYPLLDTEYREFTAPASSLQAGVANQGVAYAKVQTPMGPAHLFCAAPVTGTSGMAASVAQALNATHSQEVLSYIQSKAGSQMAVFMGDTGSGPAVTSSLTGAANANWPTNFALLQTQLTDALLANRNSSNSPQAAPACTYGCSGALPPAANGAAAYTDHIMTSGRGTVSSGYSTSLCHRQGGPLFTTASVDLGGGSLIHLSEHFGVRTDISLAQLRCDADADGDIDQQDLNLISRQRGKAASTLPAAYDANGDGQISIHDVSYCTKSCTRPKCASF